MEKFARFILLILLAAAVAVPLAGKALSAQASPADTVILHARMPENGGWSSDTLQAAVGQPLHLRLTSDDVQHSFTVGQYDMQPVHVVPGEWKDITLVFDHPGTYTYYCTRWCGPQHWRMRGTIEVTGGRTGVSPTLAQPLYQALNLDLDAPHVAQITPQARPDASKLSPETIARLPAYARDRQTYLSSTPSGLWQRLRAEPGLSDRTGADLWDAVTWVWQNQTSAQQLTLGRELFAQNCSACHGETGRGDGVMLRDLPPYTHADGMSLNGHEKTRPPDFSDPSHLLSASPALLEGKIIRGGMGTGMPYWGTIFTQPQLDALVSYLYTLIQYQK